MSTDRHWFYYFLLTTPELFKRSVSQPSIALEKLPDMKLYRELPGDWRELQQCTARFFSEMGYRSETEKTIRMVRGEVNVDVHAQNDQEIPKSTILCECKYWNTSVPKTVVHAFRTVVADYGANYGIIISSKGFQSGAIEAAGNTNLLLFTWDEFQTYFEIPWLQKRQLWLAQQTVALHDYVSAGFRVFFREEYTRLSPEQRNAFEGLCLKHFNCAFHAGGFPGKIPGPPFFKKSWLDRMIDHDFAAKFASYQEYFDFLLKASANAIVEFDSFFGRPLRLAHQNKTDLV